MLLGQALVAENYDDGTGVAVYEAVSYTPWISRQADSGLFGLEITFLSPAHTSNGSIPAVTMYVQTKNRDEADSAATTAASSEFTSSGVQTPVQASGLKELVRLKFKLSDVTGSAPVERAYNAGLRPLRPSWKPN
jgi:hypothetical protein